MPPDTAPAKTIAPIGTASRATPAQPLGHSWLSDRRSRARRTLGSICLFVGAVACLAGCGLDRSQEVRVGVEQLTSIAAEGALMADDLARNRTTTTFVRVHGDELSAQAQHEAEKLNDDSIPRDLKMRAQRAIKLASEIGGAIDELRTSPQDRGQDRQNGAMLRRWSAEADKIANST